MVEGDAATIFNSVAHSLAQFGRDVVEVQVWRLDPPYCILDCLAFDLSVSFFLLRNELFDFKKKVLTVKT